MAKYETEAARKVARALARVTSVADLRELRHAAEKRRQKVAGAISRARLMAKLDGLRAGDLVMKGRNVLSGGVLRHGVVYVVKGIHRGRKHIGAWLAPKDSDARGSWVWVPWLHIDEVWPYKPEDMEGAAARDRIDLGMRHAMRSVLGGAAQGGGS